MPNTGTFGGFPFDPEVFSGFMDEQSFIKAAIIQSGILVEDPTISDLIGGKNNVGSMPFYVPIDAEVDAPLNNDGATANTPSEISGAKQTFMAIGRMKAWKAKDFTTELTGAKPMEFVGRSIAHYYRQVWQGALMNVLDGVFGVSAFATDHVTDLSVQESVAPENLVDETTVVDACNKACGDKDGAFTLAIMHSKVYANLRKLQLIEFAKYTDPTGITSEITLPTWDGKIVVVDDRGTVDTQGTLPVYKTYFAGKGSILTAPKQLLKPYYVDYDAETDAGTDKLYTKQTRVLHPNGFSFKFANVATDSPTATELKNQANWELKFESKNIPLAMVKSNG